MYVDFRLPSIIHAFDALHNRAEHDRVALNDRGGQFPDGDKERAHDINTFYMDFPNEEEAGDQKNVLGLMTLNFGEIGGAFIASII